MPISSVAKSAKPAWAKSWIKSIAAHVLILGVGASIFYSPKQNLVSVSMITEPLRPSKPKTQSIPQSKSNPQSNHPTENRTETQTETQTPLPITSLSPLLSARPSYLSSLRTWLESHKTYPRQAQARHQEGQVTLKFWIDSTGRIKNPRITQPSEFPLLNESALSLLQTAGRFKPFPPELKMPELEVDLPVIYRVAP